MSDLVDDWFVKKINKKITSKSKISVLGLLERWSAQFYFNKIVDYKFRSLRPF